MNALRIAGVVAVAMMMALLALCSHRGLQIFGWVLTGLGVGNQAIDTLRSGHGPAVGMFIAALTSLFGCFRHDHFGRFSGWPILAFLLSVVIWMVLLLIVLRSMIVPFMGYPMDYNSVRF